MLIKHYQNKFSFLPARIVFQGVDKAPPSPESFKGPEKQSQSDAINEVAPQTPSEIVSNAVSAASAIKTSYTQGTKSLASLVTNDPIFTGQPIPNNPTPDQDNGHK